MLLCRVLLFLADKLFYPPVLVTGLADMVLDSFRDTFAGPILALMPKHFLMNA